MSRALFGNIEATADGSWSASYVRFRQDNHLLLQRCYIRLLNGQMGKPFPIGANDRGQGSQSVPAFYFCPGFELIARFDSGRAICTGCALKSGSHLAYGLVTVMKSVKSVYQPVDSKIDAQRLIIAGVIRIQCLHRILYGNIKDEHGKTDVEKCMEWRCQGVLQYTFEERVISENTTRLYHHRQLRCREGGVCTSPTVWNLSRGLVITLQEG